MAHSTLSAFVTIKLYCCNFNNYLLFVFLYLFYTVLYQYTLPVFLKNYLKCFSSERASQIAQFSFPSWSWNVLNIPEFSTENHLLLACSKRKRGARVARSGRGKDAMNGTGCYLIMNFDCLTTMECDKSVHVLNIVTIKCHRKLWNYLIISYHEL